MNKLSWDNWVLWIAGRGFALLSIILGVMFFAGFSTAWQDQLVAGSFAVLLGICQFTFVSEAVKHWESQRGLSCVLWLAVLSLFVVSVSGTAGFFESRLKSSQASAHLKSDVYVMQLETVKQFQALSKEHRDKAAEFKKDGSPLNAAKQLRLAATATGKAQQALNILRVMPKAKGGSSAEAVANELGENRWLMWWVGAVTLDACALLCFCCVAVGVDKKQTVEKNTAVFETVETVSEKTPVNKTVGVDKVAKKIVIENADEIKRDIENGKYGPKPGIRQVMRETGIKTYTKLKPVFDELEKSGVLKRAENNQGFELMGGAV